VTGPYNGYSVLCGIRTEVSKTIGDLNTAPFMGEVQGNKISRLLRHKFREHTFPFMREVQGTEYLASEDTSSGNVSSCI
jgi:hypothetical protein